MAFTGFVEYVETKNNAQGNNSSVIQYNFKLTPYYMSSELNINPNLLPVCILEFSVLVFN